MSGRYEAIGGRVIYRDSNGSRVVTSAVTANGRDLERFHATAQLAQQQRRLAEADVAEQRRRDNYDGPSDVERYGAGAR